MRHAWGAQAVFLGAWEGLAYLGAVRPVSGAYAAARRRYGRKADLLLSAWLFGLALHLVRSA